MNQWPFIAAAYAVALLATFGLTGWSFAAMRRSEREADALKDRK
ncbi:MAG TPA: hypothetical protein VFR28_10540 [Allosphingosinicella sp.]|jgi:putative effector of murein hydrolase LrgA (UPF0299 family)|nr:hypothetical protein [Allosphingosinicella sp.]